ncbi:hypothetical protein OV079_53320 [Nannocystis pusilla]|uniref:Uncharacterized protein n=1 Tax=Nannocystis pusilla TaxID=889268 RepID=A0A9X3J2T8_9BACT|nr:hypothetical protein [Nannocystis pusilla]MCY1014157.1 hypothetical protein [Nannocystis pusilla]
MREILGALELAGGSSLSAAVVDTTVGSLADESAPPEVVVEVLSVPAAPLESPSVNTPRSPWTFKQPVIASTLATRPRRGRMVAVWMLVIRTVISVAVAGP